MKTLEMKTDDKGRQTIIVPDGMEVVVKDNGELMLVEKQDIFETLKNGDIFASEQGIYIFKSVGHQPTTLKTSRLGSESGSARSAEADSD